MTNKNTDLLREEMLLGKEAIARLRSSHVAVFGLGGVGSWCAEALARCGVGEITLVDEDTVSESNLNRQLCATLPNIGREKAVAMAERLLSIRGDLIVHPMVMRYEAASREQFFREKYDYIVDAIDLVSCKLDLILSARERSIPVISALGTGNKLDGSRLQIADIADTRGCPLARVVRKELRRRGVEHHTVVYSDEEALSPEQTELPPPGRRSIPGSVAWVPAIAGFLLAQHVVLSLAEK
ncbi:MAG: tRNA threonylcarbamoyladenosine dehydratase [Oscillospiraceae bacterium]|nr:tRNA threonylcarbamoyladenosine dehydratase [Oscillospiraceae bacterium]